MESDLVKRLREMGDAIKVTPHKDCDKMIAEAINRVYTSIFYEAADALSRRNEALEEAAINLRDFLTAAPNVGDIIGDVPDSIWLPFVHALKNADPQAATTENAAVDHAPAESATVVVPSDDVILALVYENFKSDAARKQLLRTVWKDSIDIDEPNYYLKCFVQDMLAAAQGEGK